MEPLLSISIVGGTLVSRCFPRIYRARRDPNVILFSSSCTASSRSLLDKAGLVFVVAATVVCTNSVEVDGAVVAPDDNRVDEDSWDGVDNGESGVVRSSSGCGSSLSSVITLCCCRPGLVNCNDRRSSTHAVLDISGDSGNVVVVVDTAVSVAVGVKVATASMLELKPLTLLSINNSSSARASNDSTLPSSFAEDSSVFAFKRSPASLARIPKK